QVVGWFSSIYDVTELRRLEERFRLAVQAAPCGMIMADAGGKIVLVNTHAEKLFGYSRDQLIGRPVDMLVPERFRRQHPGHREFYADAPSSRPMGGGRNLYALRKDGTEVPVEIGLGPIETEQGVMVLNSIVDITERKNAEEALRRLNEELEERVRLRTAALGQANEKLNNEMAERRRLEKQILEIAERSQRRFGQELHEGLGQELAGIWFLCNVLADKLKNETHPEAPAVAELAKLLQGSLDATRNLARVSYPVELETGGLLAALESLAERTEGLFNVHCTLRCDWPRMFTLPDHMGIHVYRVVQEALTNAIKHGHPQNIAIECRSGPNMRTITVTDDGDGFAPSSESSGMGLHLMRYRAQIVGAQLNVRRAGEKGCVVTCTIPVRN
ncbi:MAG TPA: PAS domain S-box protein, partial [Verrucomicrobiaceae bacterium]